jgi:TetR/AcrR family transcriptional regulator, transcriptional repressor for nem operon
LPAPFSLLVVHRRVLFYEELSSICYGRSGCSDGYPTSTGLVVQLLMLQKSPPKRPNETRERLLELAEAAVMAKGFAATSIEELIAAAGITKSGFFYHFKDKNALAKALILRYLVQDKVLVDDLFKRGDELNEDPLHGFLVGLRLFAELMADLPANHPGCLAASFAYSDQLFDREVRELNKQSVLQWRLRFRERLDLIAQTYPPKQEVDLESLADMALALIEGGLVMGRLMTDPTILPRHVLLYRDLVRFIFQPDAR